MNMLIAMLFGDISDDIEFEMPNSEKKFCLTTITIDEVNIIDRDKKEMFDRIVSLSDGFYVSVLSKARLYMVFSVDYIWEE